MMAQYCSEIRDQETHNHVNNFIFALHNHGRTKPLHLFAFDMRWSVVPGYRQVFCKGIRNLMWSQPWRSRP